MVLTFILALFFLLFGLLGMILPFSSAIRDEVIDVILTHTITLSLFGFALFVAGIGVIVQLLQNRKRRYFRIQLKNVSVDVSEKIIHDYLSAYFQELFPFAEVPCQVAIKKKKAKVIADLPYVAESEQEGLLKKIEADLADMFREAIGYPYELLISVSFANEI